MGQLRIIAFTPPGNQIDPFSLSICTDLHIEVGIKHFNDGAIVEGGKLRVSQPSTLFPSDSPEH